MSQNKNDRQGQQGQQSQKGNTSQRGFASMDQQKQREVASKGGQSVPDEKRSFAQNRELASEAGRKGGQASHSGSKNNPSGGRER